MLHLQTYNLNAMYQPRKEMYIADTGKSLLENKKQDLSSFDHIHEAYYVAISEIRMEEIMATTTQDEQILTVKN